MYTATSSELHKKLEEIAEDLGISVSRDKAWPKSARWLWRRIRDTHGAVVAVGIETSRRDTNKASEITLRKHPTDDSTSNSTGDEFLKDKPDSRGISCSDDSTSNSTLGSNSTQEADSNGDCGNSGDSGIIYGTSSDTDPLSSDLHAGESTTLEKLRVRKHVLEEVKRLYRENPSAHKWTAKQVANTLYLFHDFDQEPPVEEVDQAMKEVSK